MLKRCSVLFDGGVYRAGMSATNHSVQTHRQYRKMSKCEDAVKNRHQKLRHGMDRYRPLVTTQVKAGVSTKHTAAVKKRVLFESIVFSMDLPAVRQPGPIRRIPGVEPGPALRKRSRPRSLWPLAVNNPSLIRDQSIVARDVSPLTIRPTPTSYTLYGVFFAARN